MVFTTFQTLSAQYIMTLIAKTSQSSLLKVIINATPNPSYHEPDWDHDMDLVQ